MATGRSTIPLHKLNETTADGFVLKTMPHPHELAEEEALHFGAHRDDHYLFFLIEKGKSGGMADFNEFVLNGNSLFFILPGQVHQYVRGSRNIAGWFLAIDTG